jgi:hypothetical protein
MGIHEQIHKYPPGTVVAGLFAVWIIYLVSLAVYRLYFSSLARFPGPKLAAVIILPKLWHMARGEMVAGSPRCTASTARLCASARAS